MKSKEEFLAALPKTWVICSKDNPWDGKEIPSRGVYHKEVIHTDDGTKCAYCGIVLFTPIRMR